MSISLPAKVFFSDFSEFVVCHSQNFETVNKFAADFYDFSTGLCISATRINETATVIYNLSTRVYEIAESIYTFSTQIN